jgi:hypothetical protein
MISGNYVNDQREGEWDTYNPEGKVISKEMYYHNKVYQRNDSLPPYNPPKPPEVFNAYMDRAIKRVTDKENTNRITITFTVTTEGKITDIKLLRLSDQNDEFARNLLTIVKNSPAWKPANTGDESNPIQDFAEIAVSINNGIVETSILDQGKARFYNITH